MNDMDIALFLYVGLPLCLVARYLRKIYMLFEKKGGDEE